MAFVPPLPPRTGLLPLHPSPLCRGPCLRPPRHPSRVIVNSAEQPTSDPPKNSLSVSNAVSSAPTLNAALTDAVARSLANLSPGGPPTLAIVFVSVRYAPTNVGTTGRHSLDTIVPRLRSLIPALSGVIGCTVDGVIGSGPTSETVEVENIPAISLTLLRLPGIRLTTFHLTQDEMPSLDAPQSVWHSIVNTSETPAAFILFSDPAFAERGQLARFLSGLDYAYPGTAVVGALAAAGAASPTGHMFCTLKRDVLSPDPTSLRDSGFVGIALSGDVQVDCLVSSACRPIGPCFEVRKVGPDNTILEMELVGRPSSCLPATGQLKSIVSYATPVERRLLEDRLYMGIAVDELSPSGGKDPYLIRHVIGADMYPGGITVSHTVRPGQHVQFHVMDAETALDSIDSTLQKYKRAELANSLVGYSNPPFGALSFVDVGRGRQLLREPRMETANLSSFAPGVPVAGCFSGGQIGPFRSTTDRGNGASILHMAGNLVALVRRRSGMTAPEPMDSPSTSSLGTDDASD